jgi:hypothetical protein
MAIKSFALQKNISSTGIVTTDADIYNLNKIRFITETGAAGTTITIRAKLKAEEDYTVVGSISGVNDKTFDVRYYELLQVEVTTYGGTFFKLVAAGFRTSASSIEAYDGFVNFPDATGSGAFAFDSSTFTLYYDDPATQMWSAASSGTTSLTSSYVGYGSDLNQLTGENTFTYNTDTNTLFVDNIEVSNVIEAANLSGTNTGDVTVVDSDSIDLSLVGQQLTADLKLSAQVEDVDKLKALLSIETDGLLAQVSTNKYDTAVYVHDLFGDDLNDGSIGKPLKTMTAALASILDASVNKRYAVFFQGNFTTETFSLKPFVILVGVHPSVSRLGTINYTAPTGTSIVGIINATVSTINSDTSVSAQHAFRTHNCELNTVNVTGQGSALDQYVFVGTNINIALNFSGGFCKISGGSLTTKPSITNTALGAINIVVIYGSQVVSGNANLTGNALLQLIGCEFTSNITSSDVSSVSPQILVDAKSYPQGTVSGTVIIVPTGNLLGQEYLPSVPARWINAPLEAYSALEELSQHQYNSQKFTLTPTEIANKFVTIEKTPVVLNRTTLNVIGGVEQSYGVDFIVIGNQVTWNGYLLETLLEAGDEIIIKYL